jgi:hypothetical protein
MKHNKNVNKTKMTVCPEGKILNPITNRCVNKTGKIGLALLGNKAVATPKQRIITKTNTKAITIIDNGCNKIGMTQTLGTCWFNSIMNTFLLSQNCYSFFVNKYNQLGQEERQSIENEKYNTDICPVKLKRNHFYHMFQMYNKMKSNPKNIISKAIRFIETRKHAENLINKFEIREKDWMKDPGFQPYIALSRILPIILDANEYTIYNTYDRIKKTSPKPLRFIFLITSALNSDIMDIQKRYVVPKDFVLDHVSITVAFTIQRFLNSDQGHAFAGYICNGEYLVYDSNFSKFYKVDWRFRENVVTHFRKEYKLLFNPTNVVATYSYVCFTRI